MANEHFTRLKDGDSFISAKNQNALQRTVEGIAAVTPSTAGAGTYFGPVSATRRDRATIVRFVRLKEVLGLQSNASSLSEGGCVRRAGNVIFNASECDFDDVEDEDSDIRNVVDPYGCIYDEDEMIPVIADWSGNYLPLYKITVRHAVTCKDENGSYPEEDEEPNVYPVKFIRVRYEEQAGKQEPEVHYLAGETMDPDAFIMNLADGEGSYLEEGQRIWCYHITDQWYTYAGRGPEMVSSSGSKSKSKSKSGSDSASRSASRSRSGSRSVSVSRSVSRTQSISISLSRTMSGSLSRSHSHTGSGDSGSGTISGTGSGTISGTVSGTKSGEDSGKSGSRSEGCDNQFENAPISLNAKYFYGEDGAGCLVKIPTSKCS